tara:strand:- start:56 stop:490 length:435 start_codon:yes stop_codon:yes gene_type:complete
MENIPDHIRLEVFQYLNIKTFISICFTSKSYTKLCKEYLRTKKIEFEINKTKKTMHNCLYRITSNCYTPLEGEKNTYKILRRRNKVNDIIVKIVKKIPCPRIKNKIKITYWVISKMGKVGERYCIYPEWKTIDCLEDENFIPFY